MAGVKALEGCERQIVRGRAGSGRWALLLVALSVFFAGFVGAWAEAQEVRHLYDAKGQLAAVIDVDGSAATFQFDENGNLTGIQRTDASSIAGPVGITLVSPNEGLPGDGVEIFGKGLANPTSVTFNGVATTVTASTSTSLKTSVPSGATTGVIHVVTPSGAADSPSPFTVLATLTITPSQVSLLPTRTQQFTASGPATWTVEGLAGGSPQVGTISTTGLYTAPGSGLFPRLVTVAAQSPNNPTNKAEAPVTIVPVPVARTAWVSVTVAQTAPRATPLLAPRVSAAGSPAPPQAAPLRANRVSAVVSPTPTQASPLRAPRVSAVVSPTPAQAAPLAALRVAVERQPVITGVSPASLARGSANVPLTLTGQGLASPTALQFLRNGANDTLITYSNLTATPDGTQATVTINIAGTAVIAGRVLQITAGGLSSTPAGTGTNVLQITGP